MTAKYEQLAMKQTRAEMIRVYDEPLKKLETKAESGLPEKKMEQKKKVEKEIVVKASTCTVEKDVYEEEKKSFEGASGAKTLSAVSEIALEQAKKPEASK